MERKWCEKLWRAMPRVQRRKNLDVARVLERAAKRQCTKLTRAERMVLRES